MADTATGFTAVTGYIVSEMGHRRFNGASAERLNNQPQNIGE